MPTSNEIIDIKRKTGKNWSCHDNEKQICAGFVERAKELNLDYKSGDLASYQKWYLTGES